jgi:hypothetical protein
MLSGYQIVVYGRRAFNFEKRDSGAKPWWQKEHLVEADRQESSAFSTEWLGDVLAEFGQPSWEKPAFHLRRSWSRIKVLDLGERLGAELAGAVQELLPVLREIRGESPAAGVSAVT